MSLLNLTNPPSPMESVNKTPHTLLPWHTDGEAYITSDNMGDELIFQVRGWGWLKRFGEQFAIETQEANLKFVVTACNNHYQLLEKLEQFITLSENNSITYKELEEARKLIFRIKNG